MPEPGHPEGPSPPPGPRRVTTRVARVDPRVPDPEVVALAARALRAGQLVAFPTETVYGLGADALDERAVRRVFEVKGRPADNPVIVHVASVGQALEVASPDAQGRWEALARRFWPGPLTLVLPGRPELPPIVTAGLDTVAVRMPRHEVALALIRAAGRPVAAPSANRSGRPSPSRAEHVLEDLGGLIEWILDGGPTEVGVESTVLDLSGPVPVVLRPGGVTVEELRAALGRVELLASGEGGGPGHGRPRSPGVKYRHYAPDAPMVVLEGSPAAVAERIAGYVREGGSRGMRLGLLVTEETRDRLAAWGVLPGPGVPAGSGATGLEVVVCSLGSRRRPDEVARRLFEGLRALDAARPHLIMAEALDEQGLGVAVNNRLRKAAGGRAERCAEPP